MATIPVHPQPLDSYVRERVQILAGDIGERHVGRRTHLAQAADWIGDELAACGVQAERHPFSVEVGSLPWPRRVVQVDNLIAEIPGRTKEILVVGAHYDTVPGTPGANDNGTGVVATLALAKHLAQSKPQRTIRLAFFVNEEPPFFHTEEMGSVVYATACQDRGDDIYGAISLEMLGCYLDKPGSQMAPANYPRKFRTTGDFLAFVSDKWSRAFTKEVYETFRLNSSFRAQLVVADESVIPEVSFSDHWSFEHAGYLGMKITDTGPMRYPHYHRRSDTPDKIDYARFAEVVQGICATVRGLADAGAGRCQKAPCRSPRPGR